MNSHSIIRGSIPDSIQFPSQTNNAITGNYASCRNRETLYSVIQNILCWREWHSILFHLKRNIILFLSTLYHPWLFKRKYSHLQTSKNTTPNANSHHHPFLLSTPPTTHLSLPSLLFIIQNGIGLSVNINNKGCNSGFLWYLVQWLMKSMSVHHHLSSILYSFPLPFNIILLISQIRCSCSFVVTAALSHHLKITIVHLSHSSALHKHPRYPERPVNASHILSLSVMTFWRIHRFIQYHFETNNSVSVFALIETTNEYAARSPLIERPEQDYAGVYYSVVAIRVAFNQTQSRCLWSPVLASPPHRALLLLKPIEDSKSFIFETGTSLHHRLEWQ